MFRREGTALYTHDGRRVFEDCGALYDDEDRRLCRRCAEPIHDIGDDVPEYVCACPLLTDPDW